MTIILLDTAFLAFSFLSLILIFFYVKAESPLFVIKNQLITVFILHAFYSLLVFLQWTRLTDLHLEKLEDLTGVLIPISWLFLFYLYQHKMDKLKIKRSEERLSLAIKAAKCGIWDWNLKTGERFFDPNYFSIAGYEANELPNFFENWRSRVHPDDIKYIETQREKYLAGELPEFKVEFRVKAKNGKLVWLRGRGEILERDDKGNPVRFTGIHTDVTDLKEAEAKIKESERFLNSVVDNIPDMIFVKDADELKFVQLNKAGEGLLGYPREEMIGKSDYDFFHKEEADFFTKNDRKVLSEGTLLDIPEERIQTRHLGERILKTKKITIPDDTGNPKYLLGISEDITDFKKMADKLRQAQKMEAIGTLAGGIAHDFNNILSSILGFSEMLKEDLKDDETSSEFVNQVLVGGYRAKELVNQILLFSRQSENERIQVKVLPIIKEVIKMLRASLPSTIEIKLNILSKDNFVLADPTQIHQILMNLCTNSAHAMRMNGGILSIEIDQKEIGQGDTLSFPTLKTGRYLKFTVRDTGHGIPPDMLDKIFDPFFSTKPRGEGTGLGLSVVHGIVKDHGGEIKVYSELDKGTAFSIFLPLLTRGEHPKKEEIHSLPGGTEHLLLVDDEQTLVDLGKIMLERLGYRVTAVSDSRIAWQMFKKDTDAFDMIITDRTMPGLTGMELSIKIQELCPGKPIILCTGFSVDYTEAQLKESGIQACVYKPILKKELAETVRNVFDQAEKERV